MIRNMEITISRFWVCLTFKSLQFSATFSRKQGIDNALPILRHGPLDPNGGIHQALHSPTTMVDYICIVLLNLFILEQLIPLQTTINVNSTQQIPSQQLIKRKQSQIKHKISQANHHRIKLNKNSHFIIVTNSSPLQFT